VVELLSVSSVFSPVLSAMGPESCNGYHCSPSPTGAHYWLVPSPDGPYSEGECRYCRDRRLFRNFIDTEFNIYDREGN